MRDSQDENIFRPESAGKIEKIDRAIKIANSNFQVKPKTYISANVAKAPKEEAFDENSPQALSGKTRERIRFRALQSGQWFKRFQELVQYQAKHGHCHVPQRNRPENVPLARWVKRQRYQYKLKKENKHSTLTEERKESLDQLGFVWRRSHGAMWEDHLAELRAFSELHGQCNLPKDYPQYRVLATWVKSQRRQYKLFLKGQKTSMMTTERAMKLTEIGFDWNPWKGDRKLNNWDDVSASSESSSSLYI
jgi:hypothetical protein